jgi:hypothetical protein
MLADALFCLPFSERQKQESCIKNPNDQCKNHDSSPNGSLFCSTAIDDDDLFDCFVHLTDQAGVPFVLDCKAVADAQTQDAELQQLAQQDPNEFVPMVPCQRAQRSREDMLAKRVAQVCCLMVPPRWFPSWGHNANAFHNPRLKNAVEDTVSRCDAPQRHADPREAALLP